MINAAQSPSVLIDTPWLSIAPGVAIAITVLAVNFIGDGMRDTLDPRNTKRACGDARGNPAAPGSGSRSPRLPFRAHWIPRTASPQRDRPR